MQKTPVEWIIYAATFAFAVAANAIAVWRWLVKPIQESITTTARTLEKSIARDRADLDRQDYALEQNIFGLRTEMTTAIGRLEMVERAQGLAGVDREAIHRDIGTLTEQVKELSRIVREGDGKHTDEWVEVRDRLARIETKLDR